MANSNLYGIPTYKNFLKGLEEIKQQQLLVKENHKIGQIPSNIINENGEFSVTGTGVFTPKDQHYLINVDGSLSFTQLEYSPYQNKEVFPPFSCAELLLESKNDFAIDYDKAAEYYKLNIELVQKDFIAAFEREEFKPGFKSLEGLVKEQTTEVKELVQTPLNEFGKKEVEEVLNHHFNKIESLINDYTSRIQEAPKPSIQELQKELKVKLIQLFKELKSAISQKMNDFVQNASFTIHEKVHEAKLSVNNTIADRMQTLNDKIKGFSAAIDTKFQVVEKEIDHPKVALKENSLESGVAEEQKMRTWEREGYIVEERDFSFDLHHFDVVKNQEVIATIMPSSIDHMNEIIDDLNNGEDVNGWEDGMGNTIHIDTQQVQSNDHDKLSLLKEKFQTITNEVEGLKTKNQQLSKANEGLSIFFKVVQNEHPKVFNNVLSTIHERTKQESITLAPAPTKKQEVELAL